MRLYFLLLLCLVSLILVEGAKKKKKPKPKNCYNKNVNDNMFTPFTGTATGCSCWWDPTSTDCACCVNGGKQCGYPKHNFCFEASEVKNRGCPGVCNKKYTMSQKGYPCYSGHHKLDCAVCVPGATQCAQNNITGPNAPGANGGSRCGPRNGKYCDGVQGDCRHIDFCDMNAECLKKKDLGHGLQHWECRCNDGYTGNGIQCLDANGTVSVPGHTEVIATLEIHSDIYSYPHTEGDFPLGSDFGAVLTEMGLTEASCAAGTADCQSSFNTENILN